MSSGQYWQPANDPPPPRQHGQYSEYQAASPPSDADPYSYSPDHQQAPSRPGDFENSPPLQQVPVRKPTTPIVRKPVSAEAYQPLATPPPAAPPSAQNTPDYSYSPVPDASYNYQDAEPSISQQFLLPQEELSQKGPEVQPGARNPGLQTRYSTLALPGCQKLGHRYRPLKQFRKLAIPLLIRWVISLLLCGLVIALFVYFVEEKVLSKRKKRIFNGLFMGLSLAIGMNLGNALVTIADIMKWRILASGKWTAREVGRPPSRFLHKPF